MPVVLLADVITEQKEGIITRIKQGIGPPKAKNLDSAPELARAPLENNKTVRSWNFGEIFMGTALVSRSHSQLIRWPSCSVIEKGRSIPTGEQANDRSADPTINEVLHELGFAFEENRQPLERRSRNGG